MDISKTLKMLDGAARSASDAASALARGESVRAHRLILDAREALNDALEPVLKEAIAEALRNP